MTPSISIIIPIYNTEKYLQQCLESIMRQTFTDFEAIWIDDGPTDIRDIIDVFANEDGRFKIVRNKNARCKIAADPCLDMALGAYIGTFKPNNYTELNMYETFYDIDKKPTSYLNQAKRETNCSSSMAIACIYCDFPMPAGWIIHWQWNN